MKFSSILALGAAVVSPVIADYATIIADFAVIQNQTMALTQSLKDFSGPKDSLVILTGVASLTKVVQKGIMDAQSSAKFNETEALNLAVPTTQLASAVNASIQETIDQKWNLINSGLGPETERQLMKIQTNSNAFSNAVIDLVPSSLTSTAQALAAPITASLKAGVDAFANTTIPNNVSYTSGAEMFKAPRGAVAYGAVLVAALAAF